MIISLLITRRVSIPLAPEEKPNKHYFILAGSGVVLLPFVSSAYVTGKKSTYHCSTDFFSDRAWVCSTLPSSPLVMEKSHSYSEIANQRGNHHTEIAPMKIQQCYI